MYGPEILVRTLSKLTREDRYGNQWQYHSRSDHHSKVACWGIIFDLLCTSSLLQRHVATGRVYFGINHEMRDFEHDRKKNLDLVLCSIWVTRTSLGTCGQCSDGAGGKSLHDRPPKSIAETLRRTQFLTFDCPCRHGSGNRRGFRYGEHRRAIFESRSQQKE